jgi:hypothetical protein
MSELILRTKCAHCGETTQHLLKDGIITQAEPSKEPPTVSAVLIGVPPTAEEAPSSFNPESVHHTLAELSQTVLDIGVPLAISGLQKLAAARSKNKK